MALRKISSANLMKLSLPCTKIWTKICTQWLFIHNAQPSIHFSWRRYNVEWKGNDNKFLLRFWDTGIPKLSTKYIDVNVKWRFLSHFSGILYFNVKWRFLIHFSDILYFRKLLRRFKHTNTQHTRARTHARTHTNTHTHKDYCLVMRADQWIRILLKS